MVKWLKLIPSSFKLAILLSAVFCQSVLFAADEGRSNFGLNLEYGSINYTNFAFVGTGSQLNQRGNSFHATVEWLAVDQPFGTLSFGLGFAMYASARVVTVPNDPPTASERSGDPSINSVNRSNVLTSYPVETFLTYRGRFNSRQFVIPFVKVGPSLTFVRQSSSSGAPEANGKFFGIDYGGGLQLALNMIDSGAASSLKRTTGIRETFLTIEYVRTDSLGVRNSDFIDMSSNVIRAGLRFQF